MTKKIASSLLILLLLIPLSGCWDYRGLDELTIVTGVAIDKKPEEDIYQLTYEIVDLIEPIKEKGPNRKLIESEGKTIFEAVRNAKRRVSNKLYFGHSELIIICEEIARNEDLNVVLDFFIRDSECRETINVVVSQEKTARDIIASEGIGHTVISNEILEILEDDKKITSSILSVELYRLFNIMGAEGKELALPAFHIVQNDGKPTAETNGTAVFKDNKLVGFLSPEESKYFLFIVNEIEGGIFTVASSGQRPDISFEIYNNDTNLSFEYKDEKLKIKIKTTTVVFLGEFMRQFAPLDEKELNALEETAEKELEDKIRNVVKKLQTEFGSDIFGFGNMIYKKDFRLWRQLKDNWDEHFKSLDLEVEADIRIMNTATIK
ncbi:MAG TPA: Ger(x)C family spore germination protein [Clostridiales bacterium]|nr:Ger(x)C family spore germination protein [Clostridiales bacterium]